MASFLENIQKVNDSEGGILMLLECARLSILPCCGW
ncbi:hypothetical protein [Stenotrophomonas phage CM2]